MGSSPQLEMALRESCEAPKFLTIDRVVYRLALNNAAGFSSAPTPLESYKSRGKSSLEGDTRNKIMKTKAGGVTSTVILIMCVASFCIGMLFTNRFRIASLFIMP